MPRKNTTDNIKILIVDDRPMNLDALEEIFRSTPYEVCRAGSGEEALKLLLKQEYACVLLDIRMPGMDGFETAALIRNDKQLQNVPLIFVTAEVGDQKDIFQGYERGAVDFLIKPLEPMVVRSKVTVFAELYRQKQALMRSRDIEILNEKLMRLNRTLKATNSDLEHFTQIAAHDLREPLRKQKSLLDLLQEHVLPNRDDEAVDLIRRMEKSFLQMMGMVNDFQMLTRLGYARMKRSNIDLKTLIEDCLADEQARFNDRDVTQHFDTFPKKVHVYAPMVKQLYKNLIANALDHVDAKSFELHFTAEISGTEWIFGVKNTGSRIPQDQLAHVFKMFRKANLAHEEGRGAGLGLCKKVIDRHQGRIYAQSGENHTHIKFTFGEDDGDEY